MAAATFFASMFVLLSRAGAQESATRFAPSGDESANFSVDTVLEGLDHPTALVLRTGSKKAGPYEFFIAESGAGRIVRIATDHPTETSEVIAGFSQISHQDDPEVPLGPTGLAFLTRTKLVVCGGGHASNPGLLSVYVLSDEGSAIDAASPDHTAGPIYAGESSGTGKRIFFGIVKTESALFSTWADESEGWILKSGIEANRAAYLQPFVTPKQTARLGPPTGIAITPSPRPPFLVVAHRGSFETPRDSTLSFYLLTRGGLAMSLETGLHDISALAYSPAGQLYAADFSRNEEPSDGIYRLDDAYLRGQPMCRAVKIASVPRPTALAFTPEGALYVTTFGASGSKTQGAVVKITGKL